MTKASLAFSIGSSHWTWLLSWMFLSSFCCSGSAAEDPNRSLRALGILSNALQTVRSHRTMTSVVTVRTGQPAPWMPADKAAREYFFSLEHPNKFALVLKTPGTGFSLTSDGQTNFTLMAITAYYMAASVQEDLARTQKGGTLSAATISSFLAWLNSGPIVLTSPQITAARSLGTTNLTKVRCDGVSFRLGEDSWEAWIGDDGLVRRLFVDCTLQTARNIRERAKSQKVDDVVLETMLSKLRVAITMEFNDWKLDQDLPAKTFIFAPPEQSAPYEFKRGGNEWY